MRLKYEYIEKLWEALVIIGFLINVIEGCLH